jgi:hypothetical protein
MLCCAAALLCRHSALQKDMRCAQQKLQITQAEASGLTARIATMVEEQSDVELQLHAARAELRFLRHQSAH